MPGHPNLNTLHGEPPPRLGSEGQNAVSNLGQAHLLSNIEYAHSMGVRGVCVKESCRERGQWAEVGIGVPENYIPSLTKASLQSPTL